MSSVANGHQSTQREAHQARRDEERRLFARFAVDGGPAARAAIVDRFLPLAYQLARRYRNVEDIEDLEQVAAIGLVNAIDRFDPNRGLAFSSFAFPTIVGELKRHLRDRGWSVRPPRDVQELAVRTDRLVSELAAEFGRSPTVAELADRAGSTVERVLEAMQAATARNAVSLDQPRRDDEDPDGRRLDIAIEDRGFKAAEDAVLLDGLLGELTVREQRILHLRFRDDLTQSEIGELVGVSQMHVSRVLRNVLAQLSATADREASRVRR